LISGFHREVNEKCALLGYYAAMFRDNQSVPSSRICPLMIRPMDCPEMSAMNYLYSLGIRP